MDFILSVLHLSFLLLQYILLFKKKYFALIILSREPNIPSAIIACHAWYKVILQVQFKVSASKLNHASEWQRLVSKLEIRGGS